MQRYWHRMQPSRALAAKSPFQAVSSDVWSAVIAFSIVGLVSVLYAATALDLASEWWTVDSASYGLLIPPTALYIAYLRRDLTYSVPAQTDLRGLWLLAGGCMVLLLGRLAAEFFLMRISLVVVLAGLAWTFWGLARFKTLTFPFV